jgi:3-phenylpropionate/cinnamic acid dioxygenase small subunit
MSTASTAYPGSGVDAAWYPDVVHFYARQMQLLDEALVEEWARTFTEDGLFAVNTQVTVGRTDLTAAARGATEDLVRRSVQRRHWIGMSVVEDSADDEVRVRSYAIVLETPVGGPAGVRMTGVIDDRLVRQDGQLLVRHRQVTPDDPRVVVPLEDEVARGTRSAPSK